MVGRQTEARGAIRWWVCDADTDAREPDADTDAREPDAAIHMLPRQTEA